MAYISSDTGPESNLSIFPLEISSWILDPLLPGRILPNLSDRLASARKECASEVRRHAKKEEKMAIDFQRQRVDFPARSGKRPNYRPRVRLPNE
jgi:hypothetical protein